MAADDDGVKQPPAAPGRDAIAGVPLASRAFSPTCRQTYAFPHPAPTSAAAQRMEISS